MQAAFIPNTTYVSHIDATRLAIGTAGDVWVDDEMLTRNDGAEATRPARGLKSIIANIINN